MNSPGAGTATGTVEFFANGTSLGTATLSDGQATLSVVLPTAVNSITAQYSGSSDLQSSTSTPSRSPSVRQRSSGSTRSICLRSAGRPLRPSSRAGQPARQGRLAQQGRQRDRQQPGGECIPDSEQLRTIPGRAANHQTGEPNPQRGQVHSHQRAGCNLRFPTLLRRERRITRGLPDVTRDRRTRSADSGVRSADFNCKREFRAPKSPTNY